MTDGGWPFGLVEIMMDLRWRMEAQPMTNNKPGTFTVAPISDTYRHWVLMGIWKKGAEYDIHRIMFCKPCMSFTSCPYLLNSKIISPFNLQNPDQLEWLFWKVRISADKIGQLNNRLDPSHNLEKKHYMLLRWPGLAPSPLVKVTPIFIHWLLLAIGFAYLCPLVCIRHWSMHFNECLHWWDTFECASVSVPWPWL